MLPQTAAALGSLESREAIATSTGDLFVIGGLRNWKNQTINLKSGRGKSKKRPRRKKKSSASCNPPMHLRQLWRSNRHDPASRGRRPLEVLAEQRFACTRQGSNLQPCDPKSHTLSN